MMMWWWWDGDDDKEGGDLNDSDFDNENILKSCDDDPTFSAKLALNVHQNDDDEDGGDFDRRSDYDYDEIF